jgi:nucleoside-diphosphate-sugar epimerase
LVFNCASETKLAQTDAVYQEGIYKLSINCAETALQIGAKRFIELSSGCICSNETTPQSESCPIEPWNIAGKYKVKVEQKLRAMEGLNYTILRLPVVYGVGDKKGLSK